MLGHGHGYGLRSDEEYLELFGLTAEQLFTDDERRRIAEIAQRIESGEEGKGRSVANTYSVAHVQAIRRGQYCRKRQRRKDKK